MIAQEIIDSEQELWLNSPVGYPYAERINQREDSRLKSFLISLFAQGDDEFGDAIRRAETVDVVQTFLNNNFTFDADWLGARELPKGIDGRPRSRLDDPEYQNKMGFRP